MKNLSFCLFCFEFRSFVFCFVLFMSESILKHPRHFLVMGLSGPELILELLRAARARQDAIVRNPDSRSGFVKIYPPLMRMLDHGTPLASTVFCLRLPVVKLVPTATAGRAAILGHVCSLRCLLLIFVSRHLVCRASPTLCQRMRSY